MKKNSSKLPKNEGLTNQSGYLYALLPLNGCAVICLFSGKSSE
jgi:hypothetical protein